jgi:RNA-directed DNA polymerase
MKTISHFLEKRLRLYVNTEKSAVREPGQVHFLGFRFERGPEKGWLVHLSEKARQRIKKRLQEMTPRTWGQPLERGLKELNTYIVGWGGYFRICAQEATKSWKWIDSNLRRRVRAIVIRRKKSPRSLYRDLVRNGARSSRGIWYKSAQFGVHQAYDTIWFRERLKTLVGEWSKHNSPILSAALGPQLTLGL